MIHVDLIHEIGADILAERERQEQLLKAGKFTFGPESPDLSNAEKLAVLGEEFGEVCRAVCEAIPGNIEARAELEKELVQVAAVCVAWLEGLRAAREVADTIPAPAPTPLWEVVWVTGFLAGTRINGCSDTYDSQFEAQKAMEAATYPGDREDITIREVQS